MNNVYKQCWETLFMTNDYREFKKNIEKFKKYHNLTFPDWLNSPLISPYWTIFSLFWSKHLFFKTGGKMCPLKHFLELIFSTYKHFYSRKQRSTERISKNHQTNYNKWYKILRFVQYFCRLEFPWTLFSV